jgi:hypothetical protein
LILNPFYNIIRKTKIVLKLEEIKGLIAQIGDMSMKTVVILCVPRSGSSLIAGILHHLGVYMGPDKDLKMGNHVNEKGCFENQDFLSLSHNLLFEADSPVALIEMPDESKIESAVKKNEEKIRSLLTKHQKTLWGWKDPSTFHIIPYVHSYLKNPHYIIIKRKIKHIVKSTKNITKISNFIPSMKHEMSLYDSQQRMTVLKRFFSTYINRGNVFKDTEVMKEVIKEAYQKMAEFCSDKKSLELRFEQVINNPKKKIKKMERFLGLKHNKQTFRKALEFVNPDLINYKK